MKKAVVMRGISGSGKSSLVSYLLQEASFHGLEGVKVSADEFMVDDKGNYSFDIAKLQECHGSCLRQFANLISPKASMDLVIVDNTGTDPVECAPYVALAKAFGFDVVVVSLIADPAVCLKRNQHRTGSDVIFRQDQRLRSSVIPFRWRHHVIYDPPRLLPSMIREFPETRPRVLPFLFPELWD